MGGNVAWTVRLEDGTEYRMLRWTNIFPEMTMDEAFLAGDPAAIAEALKSWQDMQADWLANKDTGNYVNHMTDAYAPYPYGLRPGEYGVIVTDFVTKTIVSCQHYTNMTRLFIQYQTPIQENEMGGYRDLPDDDGGDPTVMTKLRFREQFTKHVLRQKDGAPIISHDDLMKGIESVDATIREQQKEKQIEREKLQQMLDAGKIVSFRNRTAPFGYTRVDGMTLDEIIEKSGATNTLGMLNIKPLEPWTELSHNSDSAGGRRHALHSILRLGFELSAEELADFEKWITEENE